MASSVIKLPISGMSMYPTLKPGDICYLSQERKNFDEGDIICFKESHSAELVIHRVISKNPLQIKGDNALYWDQVCPEQIIGVIVKITRSNHSGQNSNDQIFKILSPYTSAKTPRLLRLFIKVIMRVLVF